MALNDDVRLHSDRSKDRKNDCTQRQKLPCKRSTKDISGIAPILVSKNVIRKSLKDSLHVMNTRMVQLKVDQ